jgi:Tfp pilus assembly pilus retraction ATPase PilT
VITQEGSGLHLIAGEPLRMRRHGDLITMSSKRVTSQQVRDTPYKLMLPRVRADFEQSYSVNFAVATDGRARLRITAFRHLNASAWHCGSSPDR